MKRCPECDSSYADSDQFCDRDGTPLVADYALRPNLSPERETLSHNSIRYPVSRGQTLRENWGVLAVMAFALVALGIALLVGYQQGTFDTARENSNTSNTGEALAARQIASLAPRPSPEMSDSPSPGPSPSPSTMPTPGPQAESAKAALSSSPVSTGGSENIKSGRVVLKLTNGTAIEADEAWETGEGIWYRRRGVVDPTGTETSSHH